MKLGKIFARTIALISCVALLSTNALAAIDIVATEDNGKLKVTITGATPGYYSFYAINKDVAFVDGNEDAVQYAFQAQYNDNSNIEIPSFFLKENVTGQIDLWVNDIKKTVYTKKTAELASSNPEFFKFICLQNADEINDADIEALYPSLEAEELTVNYTAMGFENPLPVVFAGGEKAKFSFDEVTTAGDTAINQRVLEVTYDGIEVEGNVIIKGDVNPPKTLKAFGVNDKYDYWIDDVEDFDINNAAAVIAAIEELEADEDENEKFKVRYSTDYNEDVPVPVTEANYVLPNNMLAVTATENPESEYYTLSFKLTSQVDVTPGDGVDNNPIDIIVPENVQMAVRVRAKSDVTPEFVKFVDAGATLESDTDFINAEAVVPSVPASLGENASANAMEWDRYKVIVKYNNPEYFLGVDDTQYFYKAYEYSATLEEDKFTVEGWREYSECNTLGEQAVTVKIKDDKFTGEVENVFAKELIAKITNATTTYKVSLKSNPSVSVYQGTSEADALTAIKNTARLFDEIYTDNSKLTSTVKITDATIESYEPDTLGTYTVTINSVDDDIADNPNHTIERIEENDNKITLYVKFKPTNTVDPGTVVGGGGIQTGPKKEEEKPEEKPDEPGVDDPVTPPSENIAPDVPANHWAAEAITTLVDKGIVSGDTTGNIRPNDNITREEVAKIVAVAQGLAIEGDASNVADSSDVSGWAKPYVDAVVKAGAFSGNADGTFAPKVAITREQFAAVIVRAYGFGEGDKELEFADADLLEWSKPFVAKAVELGIVNGYEDNTFKPGAQITRAEAFAMLTRAMKLKEVIESVATAE